MLYMSQQLKTLLDAVKNEDFKVSDDNMIQRGDAVKGISLYVKEMNLKMVKLKKLNTNQSLRTTFFTLLKK